MSHVIVFPRADPVALAKFDPRTKVCTMNCDPHMHDPRSNAERKFMCGDCLTRDVIPADQTAFGVRNDQGFWVGIWNDRETAAQVVSKGQPAHHEQVVALRIVEEGQ